MRLFYQACVVIFFGVMMTLLAVDHLIPRWRAQDGAKVSSSLLVDSFTDRDDWMRIKVGGNRVGTMRLVAERIPDSDRFVTYTGVEAGAFGLRGTVRSVATADPELNLEEFRAVLKGGPGIARGRDMEVRGAVGEDELLIQLRSDTGVRTTSVPIQGPLAISSALEPLVTSGGLIAGEPYLLTIYDPLMQTEAATVRVIWTSTEEVRVGGAVLEARRYDAVAGPMKMILHVDSLNRIVRREFGLADRSNREGDSVPFLEGAPTVVLEWMSQNFGREEAPDLMELLEIPSFAAADLETPDEGDPLEGFGLATALLKTQLDGLGKTPRD